MKGRAFTHFEQWRTVVGILVVLLFASSTNAFDNMNGDYIISATPNATGHFNTKWNEYPNGGVEFFEVYMGPMTTLYAQVLYIWFGFRDAMKNLYNHVSIISFLSLCVCIYIIIYI